MCKIILLSHHHLRVVAVVVVVGMVMVLRSGSYKATHEIFSCVFYIQLLENTIAYDNLYLVNQLLVHNP